MTKIYFCKSCDCVLMEDKPHTAIIKGELQRHHCLGPYLTLGRHQVDQAIDAYRAAGIGDEEDEFPKTASRKGLTKSK